MDDKSRGSDRIAVQLLKTCRAVIRKHVKDIFQDCHDHGHLHAAFRGAEVVFLPQLSKALRPQRDDDRSIYSYDQEKDQNGKWLRRGLTSNQI